jgi:ribonuclease P/MRP protein subunit RPP40
LVASSSYVYRGVGEGSDESDKDNKKKLNKCSYENRLRQLDLPTLRYRRIRGVMIEVYKLMHDLYDGSSCINLEISRNVNTRGNRFKLAKNQFHYDARKYCFVYRIVSIWNSITNISG